MSDILLSFSSLKHMTLVNFELRSFFHIQLIVNKQINNKMIIIAESFPTEAYFLMASHAIDLGMKACTTIEPSTNHQF